MKYKIQFMDVEDAEKAFSELECQKVILGSSVCVDASTGVHNDIANVMVKYRGFTQELNNFDENELYKTEVV